MEDAELLTTFNDALDDLNLESEQAVMLRRLLADLDVPGQGQEEPPSSAFIEEVPPSLQPITSRKMRLSGLLKIFRRKRNTESSSIQTTVAKHRKITARIRLAIKAFNGFKKSRRLTRNSSDAVVTASHY